MTAVRDAPSAAIEPLPRFLHLCYLGLAFFWACSMLTFRSSILLTGAADTPQYNTLIVVVSFLANMTVLLGVSALVERAPENLAKLSPWPFCGCILVGIAAIGGARHMVCRPSAFRIARDRLDAMRRRLRLPMGELGGRARTRASLAHGPVCPGVVLAHHHHLSRRRLPRGPHSLSAPCAHGSPANSLGSLPEALPYREQPAVGPPRAPPNRVSALPGGSHHPRAAHHRPPSFSPACSALCGRPPCSA